MNESLLWFRFYQIHFIDVTQYAICVCVYRIWNKNPISLSRWWMDKMRRKENNRIMNWIDWIWNSSTFFDANNFSLKSITVNCCDIFPYVQRVPWAVINQSLMNHDCYCFIVYITWHNVIYNFECGYLVWQERMLAFNLCLSNVYEILRQLSHLILLSFGLFKFNCRRKQIHSVKCRIEIELHG